MNQQRAVYQPLLENAPGYDLSDDEAEERSRLPLLIVIALIVLAAFAGVVWLAYNQGVARGRTGAQIVVAAPDGPIRTEPTDAGGAPTPYLGLKVYQDPLPPDAEAQRSSLAPNSQIAQPPAIGAPAIGAPSTEASTTEAPPARLDPTPAVAPPLPPPARQIAAATPSFAAGASAAGASAAGAPAAGAPAAPRRLAAPPPAASAPIPPPSPPVAAAPTPAPAAVAAAPKPAPAPALVAPTSVGAAGSALLQVGAYESEEIANTAFTRFKARFGAVAGDLSPNVQKADLGDKGIWYRLRVGPFADKGAAASACDKLKSAGATCFLAAP